VIRAEAELVEAEERQRQLEGKPIAEEARCEDREEG
jgi:hypothetical protein